MDRGQRTTAWSAEQHHLRTSCQGKVVGPGRECYTVQVCLLLAVMGGKGKEECPAGKCSLPSHLPTCLHRGSGRCSPSTALPFNSQKGGCWVSNLESQCVFSRQGLWGPCLESWTQSQGLWTWVFQVQRGEEELSAPGWSTSPSSECMAGPQGRPPSPVFPRSP